MRANRLIRPRELDHRLGYPQGRSARLARRGAIPAIILPDNEVRFDPDAIDEWLAARSNDIGQNRNSEQ